MSSTPIRSFSPAAAVRSVSASVLRARPHVPGVPFGYRALTTTMCPIDFYSPELSTTRTRPIVRSQFFNRACALRSPRGLGSTASRLAAVRALPLFGPRAVHRKAWTCRCVRPGRCAFHDARARFGESPSPISRCFFGFPRERVFFDPLSDLPSSSDAFRDARLDASFARLRRRSRPPPPLAP